ncbi:hypothetical protein SFRURICE_019353, partial [Spodoptera frugiperda]
ANLATNPGFQSTLSLGSKEVINEKAYNPFEHRKVEHPNSTIGSLVHLLKSSLGSGILAMPAAFKNAGLAAGAIGTLVVGFICTHCVYVLWVYIVQWHYLRAMMCTSAYPFGDKRRDDIHNLTPISHGDMQRLWNANCYYLYVPISLHQQSSFVICISLMYSVLSFNVNLYGYRN